MPTMSISIKNADQIKAAFVKAPAFMVRNLNMAIRKSIFVVQAQSMRNTSVKTGRLRASTTSTFAPLRGEVGPHVFYSGFVHYGTKFMKARPFLQNAVDSENPQVQAFFEEAVESTLGQISKEAG